MKLAPATIALIFLAAPAFAQSGTVPSTQEFVTKAAQSDMFEIRSSQLAADHTQGDTREFARKMIEDHHKTTSQLKDMVASGKVQAELPDTMGADLQKKYDELHSKEGEALTKQYQTDQVDMHEKAVDLFKSYGDMGENTDLSRWAADTLPILQGHLKMAKGLGD